jgi:hypothetical protein
VPRRIRVGWLTRGERLTHAGRLTRGEWLTPGGCMTHVGRLTRGERLTRAGCMIRVGRLTRAGLLTPGGCMTRGDPMTHARQGVLTVPVMGVWGEGDVALAEECNVKTAVYCLASRQGRKGCRHSARSVLRMGMGNTA